MSRKEWLVEMVDILKHIQHDIRNVQDEITKYEKELIGMSKEGILEREKWLRANEPAKVREYLDNG